MHVVQFALSCALAAAMAACASAPEDLRERDRERAARLAPDSAARALESACLAVASGEASIDPRTIGFEPSPVPIDLGARRASQYFVNEAARVELFFGPRGDCNITGFEGDGAELRRSMLDVVSANAVRFQSYYSGPNNTGVATRDVLCSNLKDGGSASLVVTSVDRNPVPGMPMLQITAVNDKRSCAALIEGSTSIVPAPSDQNR